MRLNSEVDQQLRVEFGSFTLDPADRRLQRDGEEIALTPKTFDLLLALIEGAGRLQSRDSLISTLWPDTIVEEHGLTWNVSALRKALGDTGETPQYIETVRGHGYRFICPVQTVAGVAPHHFPPLSAAETSTTRMQDRPTHSARLIGIVLAIALIVIAAGAWVWKSGSLDGVRGTNSHSIAVLPFANLSPDPANAYFASGIQEIILTKLAGIGDLRVLSRAATSSFDSHPADLAEVSKKLGVSTILTGSVQRVDDRALINLQLVDGRTGAHLWAESYRRTLNGVFVVESEVAENVVQALKATLLPDEAIDVARAPTANEHAYDDFLKAEYVASKVYRENAIDLEATAQEARNLYQRAIEKDPKFALAWARLAYLESQVLVFRIGDPPHTPVAAEAAIARARELEPALPQTWLAEGYVLHHAHHNYEAAQEAFERARKGMPEDGEIDAAIAHAQRSMGAWEESVKSYERATSKDPHDSRWPMLLGDALASLRRYDDAIRAYDRAQTVNPDEHAVAVYKSSALLYSGRAQDIEKTLSELPKDFDLGGVVTAIRFEAARIRGDAAAAWAVIENAPDWVESAYYPTRVPVSLLRAEAAQIEGDAARVRTHYQEAKQALQPFLGPEHRPIYHSILGIVEAGLGNREAAYTAGKFSLDKVPLDPRSGNGSTRVLAMVEIALLLGDAERAANDLRELLSIPAGRTISIGMIKTDPRYAAARELLRKSGDLN